MSDKAAGKRKKSYFMQLNKKHCGGSKLDCGCRGFLITCNKREKEAVREAYNILNEYVVDASPEAKNTKNENEVSDESDEDVGTALKKEVASLKQTKSSAKQFQQVDSGANNVVFVKTTEKNPEELLHKIFSHVYESGQGIARFIMRIYPVIATCRANEEKIGKTAKEVLEKYFSADGKGFSYSVNVKIRNNNGINKRDIVPVVSNVIGEINGKCWIDYDCPELLVSIDVLKTVCCLSVMRDFNKFRKYNLVEVANAKLRQKSSPDSKPETQDGDGQMNNSKKTDTVDGQSCEIPSDHIEVKASEPMKCDGDISSKDSCELTVEEDSIATNSSDVCIEAVVKDDENT